MPAVRRSSRALARLEFSAINIRQTAFWFVGGQRNSIPTSLLLDLMTLGWAVVRGADERSL